MNIRVLGPCAPVNLALFAVLMASSGGCDPRRVLEPEAMPQAQGALDIITTCIEGPADITAPAFTFTTDLTMSVPSGTNPGAATTFYNDLRALYGADREASAANFGTVAANTKESVTLAKVYTTVTSEGTTTVGGHFFAYSYSYRAAAEWALLDRGECDEDPQGGIG